jgi:anti-sigma28 factor (negative regulator of flagellin synthesis)
MEIRKVMAAYGAKSLEPVAKSDKKPAPEKVAAAPSEQVEFSDTSLSMQKLRDIINETPDVRIKVVEEIRTKIRYNGYPMESNFYKAMQNLISDKII